jgi:hypothetical protein
MSIDMSIDGRSTPRGGRGADLRRFYRQAGTACLFAILAACGNDGPGPSPIEGVYALQELNGTALPYDHEGLGCCTYLSGTVELDGGRYAAALTARNRNTSVVFTAMEWGTYTRRTAGLTFSPESVAVAPLLFDAGTLAGDTLRLAFGGEGHGSPDQFQALYLRGS